MTGALLDLIRVALFEPTLASALGATLSGHPAMAEEMVAICRRESRCQPVTAHVRDAWAGPLMRKKALRVGWLDPQCLFHRGDPLRFATRGVHGMSAAYTLRYLGDCLPPEALDIPLLSAVAATLRAASQCKNHGACNRKQRRRMWVGARRYDRTRRTHTARRAQRSPGDCSRRPPLPCV